MSTILMVLAGAAILYQAMVSYRVVRFSMYERTQKITQLVLIWALPIVGAVIAQAVLASHREGPRRRYAPVEQDDLGGLADLPLPHRDID